MYLTRYSYQHKAKDKHPTVPSQAPFNLKRLIHASVFHTKYRQRMACIPRFPQNISHMKNTDIQKSLER
mgnify:CR=1 FL=1